MMFTVDDYFTGPDGTRRDHAYSQELTHDILANAQVTVDRWNLLLSYFYQENLGAKKRWIHSGWRPKAINDMTRGAAPHSTHLTGEALDASDEDRALARWILDDELTCGRMGMPSLAAKIGLWFEDFRTTADWVHGQCVPPMSLNRIYIPSNDWAARLKGDVLSLDDLQKPLSMEHRS